MKCYRHLTPLLLIFCLNTNTLLAQGPAGTATIVRISSSHTAFPDTGRANGHTYDGKLYDAAMHYSDSSVLIVVPPDFRKQKELSIVFWFHGWFNNIDSCNTFFQIAGQFLQANKNAILVLAETSKNAPDSYGGKLEQANMFANLVEDIMKALKERKIIRENCRPGNITLAGHSGAYRVIAYILQNGGLPVSDVLLFDALYSQVDKFTQWIEAGKQHRFVHWYTNHGGGTDEVSVDMMNGLKEKKIPFVLLEEKDANRSILQSNRIVFVHSLREHNEVINQPDNFMLLLQSSVW